MPCNRSWLIEPEGIVFSAALWLSFCANLTMIFAFPNEYVQKHFILTLTCTSWIALLYLNLLKLNFFEGKQASTKTQNLISVFGISTSVISALVLMFSDAKFDSAHADPEQNSGINWFCMLEQCLIAVLYLSIMFVEKIVAYISTLKLCMPGKKKSSSESKSEAVETNDNFQNTQIRISIPVEDNEEEETLEAIQEEQNNVEQTPVEASFEMIPEQNNNQSEDTSEHANENQEHKQEKLEEEASETDKFMTPPSKEAGMKVNERSTEERKDSDV